MELQEILDEETSPEEDFYLAEGPFIGRKEELNEVMRRWQELDSPEIVSVVGPPGIGKTAFCEKARIEIEKTGAKVVTLNQKRGAIERILSPYFQKEFYPLLRKHLPGLLYQGGFPIVIANPPSFCHCEPDRPKQSFRLPKQRRFDTPRCLSLAYSPSGSKASTTGPAPLSLPTVSTDGERLLCLSLPAG